MTTSEIKATLKLLRMLEDRLLERLAAHQCTLELERRLHISHMQALDEKFYRDNADLFAGIAAYNDALERAKGEAA